MSINFPSQINMDVDGRRILAAPASSIISARQSNDVVSSTRDMRETEPSSVDEVLSMLDNIPSQKRGDRKKPSILRFPMDVGSASIPHSMQFKIFWRWEAKSIVDARRKKEELGKKIQNYNLANIIVSNPQLYTESKSSDVNARRSTERSRLIDGKLLDIGTGSKLDKMMRENPAGAKSILEETIKSTQTEIDELDKVIGNGGLTNLSQNDRSQFQTSTNLAAVEAIFTGTSNDVSDKAENNLGKSISSALGGAIVTVPEYDQMVSIYLPICTKINNEDTFAYEDGNFKALAGIAGLANIDGVAALFDNSTQALGAAATAFANNLGVGGARQLTQGTLLNPRLEKAFTQKDFRTFNFSWEMYPTNAEESQAIHDIIETFRYHAHPALNDQNFGGDGRQSKAEIMMRVPAEFEIRFLSTVPKASFSDMTATGLVENPYIPKIARCACTNISVDYTPQSVFSTFNNNAPIGVIFSISFSEMAVLHRGAVEQGF